MVRGDIKTSPADELVLMPDDNGVTVAFGMGLLDGTVPVPLVKLLFRDELAGDISVVLDTRFGQAENIYRHLHRLLHAIYEPDEHPEDAAEVQAMMAELIEAVQREARQ
jgi:hypothetical protein